MEKLRRQACVPTRLCQNQIIHTITDGWVRSLCCTGDALQYYAATLKGRHQIFCVIIGLRAVRMLYLHKCITSMYTIQVCYFLFTMMATKFGKYELWRGSITVAAPSRVAASVRTEIANNLQPFINIYQPLFALSSKRKKKAISEAQCLNS